MSASSIKSGTGVEAELERMVRLIAHVCAVPAAYVTIFDGDDQHCYAAYGLASSDVGGPLDETSRACLERLRHEHRKASPADRDASQSPCVPDRPNDRPVAAQRHHDGEPYPYRLCSVLYTPGGRPFGTLCLGAESGDALEGQDKQLGEFATHVSWLLRTWSKHPTAEATRDILEGVSWLLSDVVWETDTEQRFTKATTLSGESRDHLIGLRSEDAFGATLDAENWRRWRADIKARRPYNDFEFTIEQDGKTHCIMSSGYPIFDHDGTFKGYRGIARDVTALKANSADTAPLGFDPTTGLMNRAGWLRCLQQLLPGDQTHTANTAVLAIDIDDFARINEQSGHVVGDAVLRTVARAIEGEIRVQDRLARIGSDEFSIIAGDIETARDAADFAERVQEAFLLPFEIEGPDGPIEIEISVTIGIAMAPQDGKTADDIISSAGLALIAAREASPGSFDFYSETMRTDMRGQMQLDEDIKNAVAGHEFELFYQPQLSLDGDRIVGAEALLRWRHPTRGLVPPGLFIDALEASPYAPSVGNWVVQECCRQASEWRAKGHDLRVGLNMSVSHFQPDNDVIALLKEALRAHDLPPSAIEMEVTENVVFESGEMGQRIIQDMRELGVHVAFDDFGTGYGSLSDLRRIAVDRIKIDRTFVMDSVTNPRDKALLEGIISLVKSLGLATIAEGVEDEGQEQLLRSFGCDEVQGYLYAKPMPADAFLAMLEDDAQDRAEDRAESRAEDQKLQELIEQAGRRASAMRAAG